MNKLIITRQSLGAAIAVLATLTISAGVGAQVTNGSFETSGGSFAGWSTVGYTAIENASFGAGPTDGSFDALAATDHLGNQQLPIAASLLEADLGLSAGTLTAIVAPDTVTEGSAISQSFSVNAGDVLTFDWDFLTNETIVPINNDFAFVVINGVVTKLADTNSTLSATAAALQPFYASETGFSTFTYTVGTSGTLSLAFGAVNVNDQDISSGILVDNVRLKQQQGPPPVPEPGPIAMVLGSSAGAFGLLLRRRSR